MKMISPELVVGNFLIKFIKHNCRIGYFADIYRFEHSLNSLLHNQYSDIREEDIEVELEFLEKIFSKGGRTFFIRNSQIKEHLLKRIVVFYRDGLSKELIALLEKAFENCYL